MVSPLTTALSGYSVSILLAVDGLRRDRNSEFLAGMGGLLLTTGVWIYQLACSKVTLELENGELIQPYWMAKELEFAQHLPKNMKDLSQFPRLSILTLRDCPNLQELTLEPFKDTRMLFQIRVFGSPSLPTPAQDLVEHLTYNYCYCVRHVLRVHLPDVFSIAKDYPPVWIERQR